MGAWADIDSTTTGVTDAIEGLATELLSDAETRSFDSGQITDKRINAAKGVVRRKVLVSELAAEVDRYDGWESMLDAVVGNAKLTDMVHEAIAYAFLHVYTDANRVQADGLYDQQGSDFEDDITEQVQALAKTAPYVMGWTADSGTSGGGAFASTMHRSEL